jgi:adenylate cyclase
VASNRRLAALMFTDIVGYTALTQADESSALKLLARHNQLLRSFFPRYHGREIKTEGDKFLVEFDSALDATTCAVELQRFLYEYNLTAAPDSKIVIRVGVHLGDVVHTGDDILGDSVNIASRIEPLAAPGGICVTEPVFSQVRNKIPNEFERLAPQTLKNVRFPMEIYRVVLPWLVGGVPTGGSQHPRLAVLPFSNISPDPKDDYISDGLTEELITVISQLPGVRVIARTSVMQYRATTKAVSQIGAELGASSILEGSVRKAGNRLRITAQLIDASSQEHLWASTYERELNDVFAVQAEIAKQVAEALRIELRPPEEARLDSRRSVRPESYLAYLKGRALLYPSSRIGLLAAKEQFELAISLDPQNGAAYAGLATVIRRIGWFFDSRPREVWDAEGRRAIMRALELEPNLSEAHTALSLIHWDDFDYVAAEREVKRALALNPSNAEAHYTYALELEDLARADEAIAEHRLGEAADPLGGEALYHYATLLLWLGRTDEALPVIEKHNRLIGSPWSSHELLSDYHLARGDIKRALEEIDLVLAEGRDPSDVSGEWRELTLAWRCHLAGDNAGARAILEKVEYAPAGPLSLYFCGLYHAELGDIDSCFRCWEPAARNRGLPAQGLRLDPSLEPVRKDPRFPRLLHELGLA